MPPRAPPLEEASEEQRARGKGGMLFSLYLLSKKKVPSERKKKGKSELESDGPSEADLRKES